MKQNKWIKWTKVECRVLQNGHESIFIQNILCRVNEWMSKFWLVKYENILYPLSSLTKSFQSSYRNDIFWTSSSSGIEPVATDHCATQQLWPPRGEIISLPIFATIRCRVTLSSACLPDRSAISHPPKLSSLVQYSSSELKVLPYSLSYTVFSFHRIMDNAWSWRQRIEWELEMQVAWCPDLLDLCNTLNGNATISQGLKGFLSPITR